MSKETLKKKKNSKQKDNILSKIKITTIRSDILLVMFVTIFFVIFIMFTYCINIINSAENNLSSSFITNLSVFNPNQTSEQFESQFPEITEKINDMIPNEYSIKGIFIVDNNTKQRLYTSLNETQYKYIPNTPRPFKLILKDEKSEYRTISFSKKFSNKTYDLYM
ncbi:MAG: hypothetical protein LUH05_00610, partial [Candidatus Gastranaerophilales bacterium]|nr:hypothetical protein [Candidatus Gastranaerophilales bacterium]